MIGSTTAISIRLRNGLCTQFSDFLSDSGEFSAVEIVAAIYTGVFENVTPAAATVNLGSTPGHIWDVFHPSKPMPGGLPIGVFFHG